MADTTPHWSEKAKRYPSSSQAPGYGGQLGSRGPLRPDKGSGRGAMGRGGRRPVLWVVLVVVVCGAVTAGILLLRDEPRSASVLVVPETAHMVSNDPDKVAKSLVRNALTSILANYEDLGTFDPGVMTPAILESLDPSVNFLVVSDNAAALAPTALAAEDSVCYSGTATSFALGAMSESGTTYGIIVEGYLSGNIPSQTLYIDGKARAWSASGGSAVTYMRQRP